MIDFMWMVRLWSNFDTALVDIFDKSKALVQHSESKDDLNPRKYFKQKYISYSKQKFWVLDNKCSFLSCKTIYSRMFYQTENRALFRFVLFWTINRKRANTKFDAGTLSYLNDSPNNQWKNGWRKRHWRFLCFDTVWRSQRSRRSDPIIAKLLF